MKKIFLTSSVILCMACPAFATGFDAEDIEAGTPVQNGTQIAGACVHDYLGVYSGSVTLRAKWQGVYKTITLNSNLTVDGGGVAANPSTLYITDDNENEGEKLLYTSLTNGTLGGLVATDHTPFASGTPLGDEVTYNIILNDFSANNGSTTASLNGAEVTPDNRALLGFYYDADPEDETAPVQMINASGILTADGLAVTGNQEWTAEWGTGTPTISGTPTRDGYQFARWDLNTDSTVDTPGAVSSDTNVYAIWNANTFNITYSCDDGEGGQGTPSTQGDTFTFDTNDAWASNLDASQCGRAGYHFTGWDCTSGNTSVLSNGGVTVTNTDANDNPIYGDYTGASVSVSGTPWTSLINGATVACVAHYEKNTIGLTFNIDGSTSGGQCTYSEGIVLPTVPTKTGFVFDGWEVVPTSLDPDENLYNPAN